MSVPGLNRMWSDEPYLTRVDSLMEDAGHLLDLDVVRGTRRSFRAEIVCVKRLLSGSWSVSVDKNTRKKKKKATKENQSTAF